MSDRLQQQIWECASALPHEPPQRHKNLRFVPKAYPKTRDTGGVAACNFRSGASPPPQHELRGAGRGITLICKDSRADRISIGTRPNHFHWKLKPPAISTSSCAAMETLFHGESTWQRCQVKAELDRSDPSACRLQFRRYRPRASTR